MLNRIFKLDQHDTTVEREVQAGLTTCADDCRGDYDGRRFSAQGLVV